MTDTVEIPQEVKELAERMGLDVNEIIKSVVEQKVQPAQSSSAQAQSADVATGGVRVEEGVTTSEAETPEQALQRELAVAQQELQQTRTMMQTMQEGRVVGSSGLSGPVVDAVPNLGGVEPGLRWAVRNGLIDVEKIADPLIRDLFKNDLGGVI